MKMFESVLLGAGSLLFAAGAIGAVASFDLDPSVNTIEDGSEAGFLVDLGLLAGSAVCGATLLLSREGRIAEQRMAPVIPSTQTSSESTLAD